MLEKLQIATFYWLFKGSLRVANLFKQTVQRAFEEKGEVSLRTPKVKLFHRYARPRQNSDKERGTNGSGRGGWIGPSPRGKMTALVNTDLATATRLLDKARVRIGWVNCWIRESVTVQRCFKVVSAVQPHSKVGEIRNSMINVI